MVQDVPCFKTYLELESYNYVMRPLSYFRLIAILILLVLPLTAQEPASPTPAETSAAPAPYLASGPRELFAKAVALAESGAVAEAKTLFKALTLAYPELPEPHLNLAILLADEGSVEESADAAEAAMYAHPICRAVIDLDFQHQLGLYSSSALGTGTPRTAAAAATRVTPSSTPSQTATRAIATENRTIRQAADPCLNLRSQPSSSSPTIECVPPGTQVRWLETAGDWSRVVLSDGRVGWMAASFLTTANP